MERVSVYTVRAGRDSEVVLERMCRSMDYV